MTSEIDLVIVTPVYEDRIASARLFQELAALDIDSLKVVAVDDGSVNEPLDPNCLRNAGLEGHVITLKRNVGHQRAIAIGLSFVEAEIKTAGSIIVMDSDGEDLPASIEPLLQVLEGSTTDVVVAGRRSRIETLRFRAFYIVYKFLFRVLVGRNISFGNFMAIKAKALKRLVVLPELWIHVASCVLMSKLRMTVTQLDRGPRYAGQSKMNFVGLALHGFRGFMVFAEDVLVRVGIACSIVAFFAIVGATAAVILKILSFATPGWFSVALGILFMVFLQTGTLTLMTLMLTGVVRSTTISKPNYSDFIETVHTGNIVSS